jgi:phthiocerol/phenolphthiocerol synthesis type-I polyketide synthase E
VLVMARTDLFQRSGSGGMTAVLAGRDELTDLLGPELVVAVENASESVVVSGARSALEVFERAAAARGLRTRRLEIGVAAHSPLLDPLLSEFRLTAGRISANPLRTPLVSSSTGGLLSVGTRLDGDYWTNHLRGEVRFRAALSQVLRSARPVVLEIGPGQTLTNLVRQSTNDDEAVAVPSLPSSEDSELDGLQPATAAMGAIGQAWCAGAAVNWSALPQRRSAQRTTNLPSYPFAKVRHWIEPVAVSLPATADTAAGSDTALDTSGSGGDGGLAESSSPEDRTVRATVAQFWLDLLGHNVASPEDNFFVLGGDSLRLVQLIGRVRDQYDVSISLRELSASPTFGFVVDTVHRELGQAGVVDSSMYDAPDAASEP